MRVCMAIYYYNTVYAILCMPNVCSLRKMNFRSEPREDRHAEFIERRPAAEPAGDAEAGAHAQQRAGVPLPNAERYPLAGTLLDALFTPTPYPMLLGNGTTNTPAGVLVRPCSFPDSLKGSAS